MRGRKAPFRSVTCKSQHEGVKLRRVMNNVVPDGKEIHRNLVDQYLSRLTFDIRLRVK